MLYSTCPADHISVVASIYQQRYAPLANERTPCERNWRGNAEQHQLMYRSLVTSGWAPTIRNWWSTSSSRW
eukprot:scaffold2357_cov399-Prasinococcus_capsulatus_cf.AAC.23